ncbi:LysM peptidoglycan-binding domain-containing protein [Specibacter sp. RAF43]|uniref:LysM peptidoglycan-binding domain-containing protein n=1 Tax=Specibacter sp. RAF43 TaxID=3233057 RepID=UPI003F9638BC
MVGHARAGGRLGADLGMAAAVLFLGGSLVFAGVSLLRHRLAGNTPGDPLTLEETIGTLAAGTGIAVVLWWAVALSCALVSALAFRAGRMPLAAATAGWSPAFMRRLVVVVLGLNLLTAPIAMAGSPSGTSPIDPRWHAGPVATAPAPSTGPTIGPPWTPQRPVVDPGPLARPARANTRSRPAGPPLSGGVSPAGGSVVVHAGDSLWSIAAASLGPYATDVEVSAAWPAWYRTNRAVIGPDPNVILPGQLLQAPPG